MESFGFWPKPSTSTRIGSMNPSALIVGLIMEAVAVVFLFLNFPTAAVAAFAVLGIVMMALPRKRGAGPS